VFNISTLQNEIYCLVKPNLADPFGVFLEKLQQLNGDYLWAIRTTTGLCLNKNNDFEEEPEVILRGEKFRQRCRFQSKKEAINIWNLFNKKGLIMHEFTDNNLAEFIKNNKIVVIDFWAPWCGPCKMLSPIIDRIAAKNQNVIIGKCNVDDNPMTASKFGITGIPTIIIINNEKVAEQLIGVQTEKRIQDCLNAIIGSN